MTIGSMVVVVTLALVGADGVTAGSGLGWGGQFPHPSTAPLFLGLLGLAARGNSGSALDHLTETIERLTAGEYDVEIETDRTDDVGRLYEAVDELADELRERKREREERERMIDAIVQNTESAIYFKDCDGRYQFVDEAAAEFLGRDPEEVVGKRAETLFDPESATSLREDNRRVVETGEPLTGERRRFIDGEERVLLDNKYPYRNEDGEVVGVLGVSRDITERKEREQQLRETKRRLELALEGTNTGVWEWDLETDELIWTESEERLVGLEPGEFEGTYEAFRRRVHPEDRSHVETTTERALENGELTRQEFRMRHEDGGWIWVGSRGRLVTDEGGRRMVGVNNDITAQKERELALESLHETSRWLLGTETETEVASLIAQTAADVLDARGVGVYLLDTESNRLEPAAFTSGFAERCDGSPSAADRDSVIWDAFLTGEGAVFTDSEPFDDCGGFVVPIGDHGTLVLAVPPPAVDDEVRTLSETLAATTEAALDRLESEASLRERDAELAARNRRLRRQIQVNDIIRRIDQSLVGAMSRDEIERAVCERLVEVENVAFAWIGADDVTEPELVPRVWAGGNEEYLDAVALDRNEAGAEPAVVAARTEEPTVVANVADGLKEEAWRTRALAHDFHSVISVPIAFDEYFYGVLTVYGTEPDAFGELERTVFAELGETIASSINAVRARHVLHGDAAVELTLQFDESDTFLTRVAREAGTSLQYEGLGTYADEEARLFFTTDGDPTDVEAVLDGLVSVTDYRLVSESNGRALFEATVTAEVIASRLARHVSRFRSIRTTDAGLEVVVDVPVTTDIRAFVEMLQDEYPSVELVARRDVQRDAHSEREPRSLLDALTDRQREVLRTAYFAGFFEWPRESTGENIAEMLDVSQPTINRHLRRGQQHIFEQLFGTGGRTDE